VPSSHRANAFVRLLLKPKLIRTSKTIAARWQEFWRRSQAMRVSEDFSSLGKHYPPKSQRMGEGEATRFVGYYSKSHKSRAKRFYIDGHQCATLRGSQRFCRSIRPLSRLNSRIPPAGERIRNLYSWPDNRECRAGQASPADRWGKRTRNERSRWHCRRYAIVQIR